MALPNLRKIIFAERTDEEARSLSRRAFFNLAGFVAAAIGFSWLADRARSLHIR